MKKNEPINFPVICRTCTKTSKKMQKLFQSVNVNNKNVQLREMLEKCTSIQAFENDGLPSQICTECFKSLHAFYRFREQCVVNDSILWNCVKRQSNDVDDGCKSEITEESNGLDADVKLDFTDGLLDGEPEWSGGYFQAKDDLEITVQDLKPVKPKRDETKTSKSSTKPKRNDKPQQCDTCGNFFSAKTNLFEHMRTHTGERPYTCGICDKKFMKVGHLSRHKRIHTDERPFSCDRCPKRFRQRNSLSIHTLAHTGERPFTCSTCGKSFKQKNQLVVHMRAHAGIKPYTCDLCGKGFTRLRVLRGHMASHTGHKTFVCDRCEKGYTTQESLRRHMVLHEDSPQKFQCTTCNLSFHYRFSLNKHLQIHAKVRKDKKFKCCLCINSYTRHFRLINHITKQHPGKLSDKLENHTGNSDLIEKVDV